MHPGRTTNSHLLNKGHGVLSELTGLPYTYLGTAHNSFYFMHTLCGPGTQEVLSIVCFTLPVCLGVQLQVLPWNMDIRCFT